MRAGFEQVQLREGSGCVRSDPCYHGGALSLQMEHLVAVCEMKGYTGDISGAMRFCVKGRDDVCGKNL